MREKERALASLYSLTSSQTETGMTKPLFAPKPTDKQPPIAPTKYGSEQQVLVLGLLRFRVLTPNHFRLIFGDDKETLASLADDISITGAPDFTDKKKAVPFVGDFEDNNKLAKLAPSFATLEQLQTKINKVKADLKDSEMRKSGLFFQKSTATKRIG